MDKQEIIRIIENFAPPHLAEPWDCSGWVVETKKHDISKIMLCLTVTDDVVNQARKVGCDMIISHHPLFFVKCHSELVSEFFVPNIDIYCAHTNLDRTYGGTTDELMRVLGFKNSSEPVGFIRYAEYSYDVNVLAELLGKISDNVRVVNNKNVSKIRKIGFCAGSGSEFIQEAFENGADAFVTGDIKFHTAVESPIVLFDVGHFESEVPVLKVFERLLKDYVEVVFVDEKSPFCRY